MRFAIPYLRNPSPALSVPLLRRLGAKVGEMSTVKRSIFLDNVYEDANSCGTLNYLEIGTNCYIGDCVYFDLSNRIRIEDNAVVSGRVSFVTHADCNRSEFLRERFPRQSARIKVGRGAWVGFGATLLNGVALGEEAVVAASSLVRDSIPSREVWAGTPARCIRRLE